MTARKSTEELYTKNISDWVGTYTGTVVYTYGDITDKRGQEGFPASLAIRDYHGEIMFDLTTHHQRMKWLFYLPPSIFSSPSIEFIRNAIHGGRDFQFRVSMTLSDKNLTGTMKMFSRTQSGSLTPRGSYLLTFKKHEL